MQAAAMQIIYKGVFQWFLKLIVGVQFTDCRFLKKEKQFIILANHNSRDDGPAGPWQAPPRRGR